MSKLVERRDEVHRKLAELEPLRGLVVCGLLSVRQEVCHRQIWTVCVNSMKANGMVLTCLLSTTQI